VEYIPDGEIDGLIRQIGATPSPVSKAGVREALLFFHRYMPDKPWPERISYMKAMDLSKPVEIVDLLRNEVLTAYRYPGADFREFHTRSGSDPTRLGIVLAGRHFRRFVVRQRVAALQSTASAFLNPLLGSGGAVQLIVPNSASVLRLG
jgi:hypothetical protein